MKKRSLLKTALVFTPPSTTDFMNRRPPANWLQRFPSVRFATAIAIGLLLANIDPAAAATYTWNTGSNAAATTYDWGTGSNWNGGNAPVSDPATVLQFTVGAVGSGTVFRNNITNLNLNSIIFSATSGSQPAISSSSGSNPLIFVNDGATGPSMLQNGTIQFNISAPISVGSGVNLSLGGSGAGQMSLNGVISGDGSISIDGSASTSWVLNAVNTYTGGTTMNSGILALQNNTGLGSGTLAFNGGAMRTAGGANRTISNTVTIGGNIQLGTVAASNTIIFTGATTILGSGATRTITLGHAASTTAPAIFAGAIGDGGNANGVTIAGTGILTFGAGSADTAANTYTGLTTLGSSGATLNLDKAAGTNAIAGNLLATAGRLSWKRSEQIADASTLTINGATIDFADTSTSDGVSETLGSLTLTTGTLKTNPSDNVATGNTINVTGTTTLTAGAFTVNRGSTFSTGALALTSAGTRVVAGSLVVGAGGLTVTHGGGTDAIILYDTNTSTAGTLTLNGDLTFVGNSNTSTVLIRRGIGTGYVDLGGAVRTFNIGDGAAADDLNISTRITNGGLTKTGAGVLLIGNTASDYTGATTVNQGTLRFASSNALSDSTNVTVDGGTATLDLSSSSDTVGSVTLKNGGSIAGTGTLTTTGSFTVESGTVNANLGGSGRALTKTTSGTVTLSGTNSYTGATTISSGKLVVDGSIAASSGVTVESGGILGGSGSVSSLTLQSGGRVAPGNSPGTLNGSGMNWESGGEMDFELGTTSDLLNLSGVFAEANEGGTYLFNIADSGGLATGLYTLVNFGSSTFESGLDFSYTSGIAGLTGNFILNANNLQFQITAVPEPSTYILLTAGLLVTLWMPRRRRMA